MIRTKEPTRSVNPYIVQLESFLDESRAAALVEKLCEEYWDVYNTPAFEKAGKGVFPVRIDTGNKKTARWVKSEFEKQGYRPVILKRKWGRQETSVRVNWIVAVFVSPWTRRPSSATAKR